MYYIYFQTTGRTTHTKSDQRTTALKPDTPTTGPSGNIGYSTLGIKRGYINTNSKKNTSLGLSNSLRLSVVWNNGHFFAGAIGHIRSTLIYDKLHTLVTNVANLEISAGYRFNLW